MRTPLVLALPILLAACSGTAGDADGAAGGDANETPSSDPVRFRVTLENVSAPSVLDDGAEFDATYAPGVWVLHEGGRPLFTLGEADRGEGLEALAEDGDPTALAAALRSNEELRESDEFDLPPAEYASGVVRPGSSFVFEFEARPGERLSFVGMYAQSNDVFFGTWDTGLPLFDDEGAPLLGERTDELAYFDLGTEENEEPGVGPNQAPRQSAPNTGLAEGGTVRSLDDGFTYAAPFVRATFETP